MVEKLAYGNSRQMIRFDVNITNFLVDALINLGYVEEDAFDIEEYYNESDCYISQELAQPIMDGVIDYYIDKVDDKEEEINNSNIEDEYTDNFQNASKLEKILNIATSDSFCDTVKVREVNINNPYK